MRKSSRTRREFFLLIYLHGFGRPTELNKHTKEQFTSFFMETPQVHIGQIIKQKLKEQGRTAVWLAQQIPCTHNHVFKIFRKHALSTDLLQRISHILDYNFFQHFE